MLHNRRSPPLPISHHVPASRTAQPSMCSSTEAAQVEWGQGVLSSLTAVARR